MNLRIINVVAAKELRDLFRDRRTIISMILVPVLSIPLLITGMSWLSLRSIARLQESDITVAVLAMEQDAGLMAGLEEMDGRFRYWNADELELPADSLFDFEDTKVVLEFGPGLEQALENLDQPDLGGETPRIRIYYDSTDDEAKMGGRDLRRQIVDLRDEKLRSWLARNGLREDLTRPWLVDHIEIAPPQKQAAEYVARFLPYLILILCLQGAMYPAMDLTAGEKERSTIETLLVNPVSRLDIILGKYIATSIMALGSALFTLGGEFVYFRWAADSLTKGALQIHLDPGAAGVGLLLLLPVALIFSAVMLALSMYARSMKEAQSYLGPLMILVIFPSMVSMVPGLKLNLAMAFLPVVNVTLLMKDALLQDYSQWGLMLLVFAINLVYAGMALAVALYVFRRESVIFRS